MDYLIFLYLYVKLSFRYKYKIKPLGRDGSFRWKYDTKTEKYTFKEVWVNILQSREKCLPTLLHEIGHLVTIRLYYKHGMGDNTTYLKAELDASKYAIRVLRLINKDKYKHRKFLLRAYETYVAGINCDKATESYKAVRSFGIKY
jgi:hypothetical protein